MLQRGILTAVLTAAALVLVAAPATAQEADCGAFAHTQTYGRWGPAAFYGQPVTVAFTADTCQTTGEDLLFTYELTGTAAIYAGEAAAGDPLAVLPFDSTGAFTDLDGSGWPPDWWSCEIEAAQVVWRIPGVYTFTANATAGAWTLDVEVPGAAPVHWDHAAC